MCARYTLKSSADVLQDLFNLDEAPDFGPRFNIAPSQAIPAVVQDDEGARRLKWLQWGLIPSWAKDPAIGQRLINARGETLPEKPAFRSAFKRRRCLIPADGFYEWIEATEVPSPSLDIDAEIGVPAKPKVYKQPYLVQMKGGKPFAFAGLWEYWETDLGGPIESGTIITTEPNELLKGIHDRMPVILSEENYGNWLDRSVQDPAPLFPLLRPYPAEEMEAFPVSRRVNNPRIDDPECVVPLAS